MRRKYLVGLTWPVRWRLRPGRTASVRGRLLLLAAAVALPLVLLAGLSIWQAYSAEAVRDREALLGRARAIAAMVDREFEAALSNLRVLATSPALAQNDLPRFDGEMRAVSVALGGVVINLTVASGQVRLSTVFPQGAPPPGNQASDFLLGALKAGRPAISDLVLGPVSHRLLVGVALPVPAPVPGQPAWMLSLYLTPETLKQRLDTLNLPPAWLASVTDRQDHVVARLREQDRFIGQTPPADVVAASRRAEAGLVGARHRAMDGVPIITAFARAPLTGYTVYIGIPEAAFTGRLHAALLRMFSVAAVLAALGLGGALLVARQIVNAFRRLAATPRGVAARTGLREIDALARAMAAAEAARTDSEARLRQSEVHLREVLATLDLASVFVRAWDGSIRYWSRGCEALYGWPAEQALGRPAHVLLRTEPSVPWETIDAALEARGEWEGDVRQLCRDGRALTVSVRKVLRQTPEGGPAVVLEVARDVTALRGAEADLRALNQSLERRVEQEVAAREAAQARAAHAERMQALGQLAGGIAHDFNNVLQAVIGGAAAIGRRAGDPDQVRRMAALLADAAQRGAAVTRRMLIFARQGDLRTEAIEPAALLAGVREILAHTLSADIAVAIAPDAALPWLLGDRGQLETALINLATNARDAMPRGGTLTLRAQVGEVPGEVPGEAAGQAAAEGAGGGARGAHAVLRPGRYVALSVSDTGTGMDAAVLARATEPFFSTKTAGGATAGAGTGLGLAMARGFAEQSGGALEITSAPGRGTTVTIWLPASAGPALAERKAAPPPPARLVADVLLVDDDEDVRESLAAGLTEMGCHVRTVASGEAALAMLGDLGKIDCLVTDLSMPGMNGIALVAAIHARHPGLPAIVLTGYAGYHAPSAEPGREGAREAAERPYLLLWKPVELGRIAEGISRMMSARAA